MLAIERRACCIIVSPLRPGDGVAGIVVALGIAGIGVSQIEPQVDPVGTYRLTVDERPGEAIRILLGIGCSVGVKELGVSRKD